MMVDSRIVAGASVLALCLAAGGAAGMDKKFGAPTEGMSVEEYQSLVFLDPQNTLRMDWDAVRGMDGFFLIDNQGEPTVSVVDYHAGETVRKLDMGETGNHHLWVIPGGRYVWSSQRYESDTFWTIDLATMEVVDKFPLSMGDKKVIAPLHVGFAYTQPAGGGRQHPRQGARLSHHAQHRHPGARSTSSSSVATAPVTRCSPWTIRRSSAPASRIREASPSSMSRAGRRSRWCRSRARGPAQ